MQNDEFYNLGVYFVMSVIQGGCGFPFLARSFDYVVQGHYKGINVPVEDIPDGTLRFIVEKVHQLVIIA